MFNGAAARSVMKVTMMMVMIGGMRVETAPTPRDTFPSLPSASAALEKSSALNLSRYMKQWLLNTKAAGTDGTIRTTTRTLGAGTMAGRWRVVPEAAGTSQQAHMLKMISALEELHRTLNTTLSSRITIIPRVNGRSSGRRNKVLPPAEGGVKSTTASPAPDSTASKASADAIVPNLTGRNFRKSLPPQTKKTNKRVCFWKYCSQN